MAGHVAKEAIIDLGEGAARVKVSTFRDQHRSLGIQKTRGKDGATRPTRKTRQAV